MTAPGDAPRGHVLWDLVRTAHVAERRFGEVFAQSGLTPAQYGVLAALADGDDVSQAELARSILVRPQSLAAVVDTLVALGLVEREGQRGRGRRTSLSLSVQGGRVLAEARPAAYRLLDREVIGLRAEELATLAALLATVRNRLDDPGPTPAADRASGG